MTFYVMLSQMTIPAAAQTYAELCVRKMITSSRALARILKLLVILEKVPVEKVDAAGENQVEHA